MMIKAIKTTIIIGMAINLRTAFARPIVADINFISDLSCWFLYTL